MNLRVSHETHETLGTPPKMVNLRVSHETLGTPSKMVNQIQPHTFIPKGKSKGPNRTVADIDFDLYTETKHDLIMNSTLTYNKFLVNCGFVSEEKKVD